jgi:hypothetical protein
MGRYMKEKPAFMPKLDQTPILDTRLYYNSKWDIDSKHSSQEYTSFIQYNLPEPLNYKEYDTIA